MAVLLHAVLIWIILHDSHVNAHLYMSVPPCMCQLMMIFTWAETKFLSCVIAVMLEVVLGSPIFPTSKYQNPRMCVTQTTA